MNKHTLLTPNDLQKEVARDGLVETWERRFQDIVAAHASGIADFHDKDLAAMIAADPKLSGLTKETAVSGNAGEGTHSAFVTQTRAALKASLTYLSDVTESDGTPVPIVYNVPFKNWGRTVNNIPAMTAMPSTKGGVCNLVKLAAAQGKRVRVAGYRHTWGNLYAADGEVLISLLPLDVVEDLPAQHPSIDPANQLQGIEIIDTIIENGAEKALCRIGAATTNGQFRRWCLNPKGGALKWTVPLNVIMVEITWGGSNASICHGAGLRNQTLSDLVAEIEFVNPNGELQVVNDPEELKAASGAFGLMGVVTAITLKIDRMTYASMKPEKSRLALTIPPPDPSAVPQKVDMSNITNAELDRAWQDFVSRVETSYYAEWFWFTLEPKCWVNTWRNDGKSKESRDYPGHNKAWLQNAEEYLAGLMVKSPPFNMLPETCQAAILAKSAMCILPSKKIVTPLIDALHFQRGIQNMRVFDMEWEIPIPPSQDDPSKPDWSICQKAWWEAITEVYAWEARGKAPMRLTLEMRVMGGSGVTLAPQNGNEFGTCSIEVLTTINTNRKDWMEFKQRITDRWLAITDKAGNTLNTRPHWAKEWQGLTVRGMPIADYLRDEAYQDRIPEFGNVLSRIAAAGGYSMKDLKTRFSNDSLTEILGAIYD